MGNTQFCPYCMSPVVPGESCPVCGLTEGSYTPAAHHLPPGTVLMDRYLVGRVLGEGGFGITYIGCDLRLELKVAIKEYFPTDRVSRYSATSLAVSQYTGAAARNFEKGKERFLYEARTMARMDKQPEIVSVRDFFQANNTVYIVMEYVEGTNFKELVAQKGGRIPAGELLYLMEPLFSALSTMHSLGLIHRDISPDNLMLENGAVRLLDFGCARESATGTETMTIALKHGYAPIEQYQNKGQGPWTDVYALSATLYYCLTGKAPPQALDRLCDDELILPRKLGVDLTEKQERALLYGMGVRPRRRFQSVEELHTALYLEDVSAIPAGPVRSAPEETREEALPQTGPQTQAEEPPRPQTTTVRRWDRLRGKRALAVGGGVAALVVIVLAAALLGGGGRKEDIPPALQASPGQSAAAAGDQTGESLRWDREDLFAGAVSAADGDEAAFRALLADPDVPAVILPADCSLSLNGEAAVLTKPVLVEAGGNLSANCAVTLEGEKACLWLEGVMNVEGFLRTSGGGGIVVEDTGVLSSVTMLWLEQQEDLTVENAQQADQVGEILVLREQDLFDGAARVGTALELSQAMDDPEVSSILVEGDIVLEKELEQTKPVLIAQGAAVRASAASSEEENSTSWNINQSALINYGTLEVGLWTRAGQDITIINHGSFRANDLLWIDENTTLINLGEMDLEHYTQIKQSRSYNLGTLRVNCAVDVLGGSFYNVDQFHLESEYFAVYDNARLGNLGKMDLAGNLEVFSYLVSCGQITVADKGGLTNHGLVELFGSGVLTREEGGAVQGPGSYQMENGCTLNNVPLPEGALLRSREDPATSRRVVATAEELTAAMAETAQAEEIVVSGALTVPGDLAVTRNFRLEEGASLTVEGTLTVREAQVYNRGTLRAGAVEITDGGALFNWQSLTLSGGGISLAGTSGLASWGAVDMAGGALSVTDHSLVNLYYVALGNCGDVTIAGGSRVAGLGAQQLSGVSLAVRDSAYFPMGGLTLSGVTAALEEGGQIKGGDLIVRGGTVDIGAGSYLYKIPAARLELREDAVVNNYGVLGLWGFEETAELAGTLHNYGQLVLGSVDLRTSGLLDNQGQVLAQEGGVVLAGGSFTGNPQKTESHVLDETGLWPGWP